ncbi:N-acetyltransferase 9-like protein isoform X2 [Pomacea canaliculata]|nr:N-acetyltransferase 9-like protein isoform X2 [Pomacea canaliculata]XP_025095145.1 N-acetyltransferase 9-like protein isoform X2 [Pomacea canaliculata]
MRINQHTQIVGHKVILVPYESYHVPKYHQWMASEELQKLTASQPLTLQEEYNMQKSWRDDEDKCTFIILQKSIHDQNVAKYSEKENREIDAMIGDVNLFFTENKHEVAEIEIMIAESSARGQGCGREALCSMLRYGVEVLGVTKFVAKIGEDNKPSISLFSQLGFTETSRSEVFVEVTMELQVAEGTLTVIASFTPAFHLQPTFDVIK